MGTWALAMVTIYLATNLLVLFEIDSSTDGLCNGGPCCSHKGSCCKPLEADFLFQMSLLLLQLGLWAPWLHLQ